MPPPPPFISVCTEGGGSLGIKDDGGMPNASPKGLSPVGLRGGLRASLKFAPLHDAVRRELATNGPLPLLFAPLFDMFPMLGNLCIGIVVDEGVENESFVVDVEGCSLVVVSS